MTFTYMRDIAVQHLTDGMCISTGEDVLTDTPNSILGIEHLDNGWYCVEFENGALRHLHPSANVKVFELR
jgi:hypothetical protein